MSYTSLNRSSVDATWDTNAASFTILEKALVLWFGSTPLRISTAPHSHALTEDELIDAFLQYTKSTWSREYVEAALKDLLSKHMFEMLDTSKIFLNVVGYPVIREYLHFSEFYAFLCSK
jgi:hypothetical protein